MTAKVVTTIDRAWVTLTGAAVFLYVTGGEGFLVLPLVFGVHCSIAVFEHVTKTGDDLLEHTLREPRHIQMRKAVRVTSVVSINPTASHQVEA